MEKAKAVVPARDDGGRAKTFDKSVFRQAASISRQICLPTAPGLAAAEASHVSLGLRL